MKNNFNVRGGSVVKNVTSQYPATKLTRKIKTKPKIIYQLYN